MARRSPSEDAPRHTFHHNHLGAVDLRLEAFLGEAGGDVGQEQERSQAQTATMALCVPEMQAFMGTSGHAFAPMRGATQLSRSPTAAAENEEAGTEGERWWYRCLHIRISDATHELHC